MAHTSRSMECVRTQRFSFLRRLTAPLEITREMYITSETWGKDDKGVELPGENSSPEDVDVLKKRRLTYLPVHSMYASCILNLNLMYFRHGALDTA